MPAHPFAWVHERSEGTLLAVLAVLGIVLSVALTRLGAPLVTDAAPTGIVSFEFSGSAAGARAILDTWTPRTREHAMLTLGLDYLYLLVYPAFISLACVWTARRIAPRTGVALSWGVLLAAPLDAVENAALLWMLIGAPSDSAAALAWVCALPKFALVFAGLGYAGIGQAAARLLRR
ncbi:MAG: hypothetical protein JRG76_18310 [Deltaproteobacteria bacterium]|nr:hypothetical protein [Deltaproteobacteria bacterium]MBW2416456.1 hypothetical protein [Deltaproteobacteria bacterium]